MHGDEIVIDSRRYMRSKDMDLVLVHEQTLKAWQFVPSRAQIASFSRQRRGPFEGRRSKVDLPFKGAGDIE